MRFFPAVFILLIIFSCDFSKRITDSNYQVIRFRESIPVGEKLKLQDYLFDVLKGGILTKGKHDFTGSGYSEYRIVYTDSSALYIGNDIWHGSRLNLNNRIREGINGINRKNLSDSIYFEGIQADGKYWKEQILNDILVGYINVIPEKKREYDHALESVRIKKIK